MAQAIPAWLLSKDDAVSQEAALFESAMLTVFPSCSSLTGLGGLWVLLATVPADTVPRQNHGTAAIKLIKENGRPAMVSPVQTSGRLSSWRVRMMGAEQRRGADRALSSSLAICFLTSTSTNLLGPLFFAASA